MVRGKGFEQLAKRKMPSVTTDSISHRQCRCLQRTKTVPAQLLEVEEARGSGCEGRGSIT